MMRWIKKAEHASLQQRSKSHSNAKMDRRQSGLDQVGNSRHVSQQRGLSLAHEGNRSIRMKSRALPDNITDTHAIWITVTCIQTLLAVKQACFAVANTMLLVLKIISSALIRAPSGQGRGWERPAKCLEQLAMGRGENEAPADAQLMHTIA